MAPGLAGDSSFHHERFCCTHVPSACVCPPRRGGNEARGDGTRDPRARPHGPPQLSCAPGRLVRWGGERPRRLFGAVSLSHHPGGPILS